VLNQADVVVVGGSVIMHHPLGQLLSFCRAARQVIVSSLTASMYPDPLFDQGVTVLGGITVHDPDELRAI
jgi:uncharacterized protein (DUF4213/DUF364 family)